MSTRSSRKAKSLNGKSIIPREKQEQKVVLDPISLVSPGQTIHNNNNTIAKLQKDSAFEPFSEDSDGFTERLAKRTEVPASTQSERKQNEEDSHNMMIEQTQQETIESVKSEPDDDKPVSARLRQRNSTSYPPSVYGNGRKPRKKSIVGKKLRYKSTSSRHQSRTQSATENEADEEDESTFVGSSYNNHPDNNDNLILEDEKTTNLLFQPEEVAVETAPFVGNVTETKEEYSIPQLE
ncbi:13682_t:CDS:2, partial [Ambispora leptoticha]